jgi:hypothetical protein
MSLSTDPPPAAAPDPPDVAAQALQGPGFVISDLGCLRCGYSLRTLARDGACPECGLPVRDSLNGRAFNPIDARRVAAVIRGCLMLGVSVAMTCGSMLLYLFVYMTETEPWESAALAFAVWVAIEHVLWVVGGVQVTRGPTLSGGHCPGGLARSVRIATALNTACMLGVIGCMAALMTSTGRREEVYLWALLPLTPATFLTRAVAVGCLGGWLSQLADNIERTRNAKEVQAIAWLAVITLTLLLLSILALLGSGGKDIDKLWIGLIVVFAVVSAWAVTWLLRFVVTLRRAARQA